MTQGNGLRDRLRYFFDNTMSRGTGMLILWLGLLSLAIVLLAGAVIHLAGIAPDGAGRLSFSEAAWESLMRTLDAGTMGGDSGWGFRFAMFIVTLAGVFVISTLIGVLTSGIESKVEELRKGRSRVIESNHSVILGWSSQVFTIVNELVEANSNQKRSCIVIMGDEDKVVMEDAIKARLPKTSKTRIVCRRGNPIEMADLELVSLNTARSIIVLSPESGDPDSSVIKVVLAITNNPARIKDHRYNIVAEIRDPKNLDVASMVGKDEVALVVVGDLIARIIAQTCRQAGLSVVYTELLDFRGDEIYFSDEPSLTGKTFGDALMAYETSTVLGISAADGQTRLNPPMDTRIAPGSKIIAITNDDNTLVVSGRSQYDIDETTIQPGGELLARPECTLVLGWNWRAPAIINELDHYVATGSLVKVVSSHDQAAEQIANCCDQLVNQKVSLLRGETTDRRLLNNLPVTDYNHIILLSSTEGMDAQESDAHTLVTLLHLRDIADKSGHPFSITSEMIDIRNRNLAEVARADDFIVSDKIVSLMMAQVSENRALNLVFRDLFDPDGSEVYLKPARQYVCLDQPVNFYTVVEAARRRGEVALGYRLRALSSDAGRSYGVFVNPNKAEKVTFGENDRIIVLAES